MDTNLIINLSIMSNVHHSFVVKFCFRNQKKTQLIQYQQLGHGTSKLSDQLCEVNFTSSATTLDPE